MKKLLFLLAIVCFSVIQAQSISDYEYVYVPQKFKNFDTNKYNLNTLLKKALEQKNYKVLQDDMQNWPENLRLNPCMVANAELLDNSNMLRTRVILQFTDCKKNMLSETKATSLEKEFDLGFQEALKLSLANVPVSQPKAIVTDIKQTIKETTPLPIDQKEIKELKKEETPAPTTSKMAESYSNGKINLLKIQISENQFILVSNSSSVPFATFRNTTKKEVYRVQLENGTQTLGYLENGNLVIEIPSSDGNYQKAVFEKK